MVNKFWGWKMEKKPTTEVTTKEKPKSEAAKAKETTTAVKEASKPEASAKESQPEQTTPKPEATKPLTMTYLNSELEALKQIVSEHGQQIAQLQEALARKRKPPASNGKVQIVYKKTGQVFQSKNSTYQTLLKAGELKELVDNGIFGGNPAKNTFGWYALVREWPERFEEVKAENSEVKTEQSNDAK